MNTRARALSKFALFAELDDDALQEIVSYVYERSFEPGQIVLFVNEPCQAVYLIVRGMVRTHRLSLEGREYVLDYLGTGEFFDLVPVLDGASTLATVEALTDTTIYLIPCNRFHQIVNQYQEVAAAALRHLATRVRYLSDTVEDLALYTVRTRLARFLLSRAGNGMPRTKRWTQEEIAAHIGTVRDVVGRTLRAFAREGMIRRERGRLVVTDQDSLKREAMQE